MTGSLYQQPHRHLILPEKNNNMTELTQPLLADSLRLNGTFAESTSGANHSSWWSNATINATSTVPGNLTARLKYVTTTAIAAFIDRQNDPNVTSNTSLFDPHMPSNRTLDDIDSESEQYSCPVTERIRYPSILGIELAVPQWEAILVAIILTVIILVTIVGNILVILSVFTYKPLRIVQNFFIVSLAVADLTVAILVLPLNVANMILGRWVFGIHLCKMWLTSDVLCCTSSILNLCAIALDRYWAITDPINYAQKRTVERVLWLIAGVWALSLLISSPPLIGWNDWPDEFDSEKHPCMLNSNPGYRVYSALGSFFIPLIIMTLVYIEIYIATRRRLRDRAKASRMHAANLRATAMHAQTAGVAIAVKEAITAATQNDQDSISSETNHNEHPDATTTDSSPLDKQQRRERKDKRHRAKDSLRLEAGPRAHRDEPLSDVHEDLITDMGPEHSSDSITQTKHSLAATSTATALVEAAAPALPKRSSTVTKKPNTVYQFIEEKQKISLSKERRAARTLGIIMGVFIACWVPFFVLYIVQPFCASCCFSDQLIDFLTWLGYINSALNPIIYTIFNLEYRRAFKKLLGLRN